MIRFNISMLQRLCDTHRYNFENFINKLIITLQIMEIMTKIRSSFIVKLLIKKIYHQKKSTICYRKKTNKLLVNFTGGGCSDGSVVEKITDSFVSDTC